MKKIVLWVIGGLLVLGIIGSVTDSSEPTADAKPAATAKVEATATATPISTPTTIELKVNTRGGSTRKTQLKVTGTVQPIDAKVMVRGKTVKTDANGRFSKTVKLKLGKNKITVSSSVPGDINARKNITVKRNLSLAQIKAKRAAAARKRAAAEAARSPRSRVSEAVSGVDASGWVGKLKLQKTVTTASGIDIYIRTPEGGFQGASVEDLNNAAGATFRAAYGKANFNQSVNVIFRGGLVSTATGKSAPSSETGRYSMTAAAASQIDWSDRDAVEFTIDWSNYCEFAHPALKQD